MVTILGGDVGGTHTRLAILQQLSDGRFRKRESLTVLSQDFECLESVIERFLASVSEPCSFAAIGVAGPVAENRCRATNIPWTIDAATLGTQFGFERVALLNDLEAQARGISYLPKSSFHTLSPGKPKPGNRALIAAGTGLGQSGLFFDGKKHHVFATEGGHSDFSPRSEIHLELVRYLTGRYGRVSWERVLSGAGLCDLFRFLVEHQGMTPSPKPANDPTAANISRAALDGHCTAADRALDLFVEFYGAEAGNLALKTLAVNGLFIGGGIAAKILDRLKSSIFLEAFRSKGRMSQLMRDIPVRVILDGDTALYGAAGAVLASA